MGLRLVGVDFDRHCSLLLHCGAPSLLRAASFALRRKGESGPHPRRQQCRRPCEDNVRTHLHSSMCVWQTFFSIGYHNSWLTLADKRPVRLVITDLQGHAFLYRFMGRLALEPSCHADVPGAMTTIGTQRTIPRRP